MVTWKIIFIALTFLLIYFSYGVAQSGGPWAFFVGCLVGSIVTYLFTRAKQEAIAAHFEARQKVQVNLNQQKTNISQPMSPEDIARIVDSVLQQKLLQSSDNRRLTMNRENRINERESRELLSHNLWNMAENDHDDRR